VRAARRGVKVHVMARAPHQLKANKLLEGVSGLRILDDVGIKIHRLKHLKLHAKMILADHERAIVGSINVSPGSFDHRRELAIAARDHHLLKRLNEVAHHDWKHSEPLDLSDAGLFADLARREDPAPSISWRCTIPARNATRRSGQTICAAEVAGPVMRTS
jgi:cardiolipin synthase A/B